MHRLGACPDSIGGREWRRRLPCVRAYQGGRRRHVVCTFVRMHGSLLLAWMGQQCRLRRRSSTPLLFDRPALTSPEGISSCFSFLPPPASRLSSFFSATLSPQPLLPPSHVNFFGLCCASSVSAAVAGRALPQKDLPCPFPPSLHRWQDGLDAAAHPNKQAKVQGERGGGGHVTIDDDGGVTFLAAPLLFT